MGRSNAAAHLPHVHRIARQSCPGSRHRGTSWQDSWMGASIRVIVGSCAEPLEFETCPVGVARHKRCNNELAQRAAMRINARPASWRAVR